MLDKTNYTTRTDLHPDEITALLRVREALESGAISARRFQMDMIWEPNNERTKCGSVGCIGGWAGHLMGWPVEKTEEWMGGRPYNKLDEEDDTYTAAWFGLRNKFYKLFYPPEPVMDAAKPEDGVMAINNFLMGSDEPWDFLKKKVGYY